MIGNSVSTKESKESRFRIVKTDSDKKAESLTGSAVGGNQQISQINTNENYTNSNNQTPTLSNRSQNQVPNGQNAKSYQRGRWHVMDFETIATEKQQPIASVPSHVIQQQSGQVIAKMTASKNTEQTKYDDSTQASLQYTLGKVKLLNINI